MGKSKTSCIGKVLIDTDSTLGHAGEETTRVSSLISSLPTYQKGNNSGPFKLPGAERLFSLLLSLHIVLAGQKTAITLGL